MTFDPFAGGDEQAQSLEKPVPLSPIAGRQEQTQSRTEVNNAPGPLFRLIRDQRIAFLIVGVVNTGIGAVWFISFLWLLPSGPSGYLGALACAHVCAVLCAFVLHRRFVFRVTGHLLRDLYRFELVNLSTLAFNFAVLPVLVEVFGWPPLPSQLAIAGVTVIYSWFAHRGFSFRRSVSEAAKPSEPVP